MNDPKITKLEQQIKQLEQVVKALSGKVALLERENNRRKMEINQISSHLRKG
jgi:regulator of replication initiation timing